MACRWLACTLPVIFATGLAACSSGEDERALTSSCERFESTAARIASRSQGEDATPVRSAATTHGAFTDAVSPPPDLEGPIIGDLPVCAFVLAGIRSNGGDVRTIVETPTDGKTEPDNLFSHTIDGSAEPGWWRHIVPV